MAKAARAFASASTDAFMNSLRVQGIAFHGPFRTQGKRVIFVVDGYLLLDSELADLLEQNKLDRDGIQELGKCIEARLQ